MIGTLHEDLCTFMVLFQFLFERKMFQKKVADKIKTHISCIKTYNI